MLTEIWAEHLKLFWKKGMIKLEENNDSEIKAAPITKYVRSYNQQPIFKIVLIACFWWKVRAKKIIVSE